MLLRRRQFLLGAVLSVLLCASLVLSTKAEASMWIQTCGGAAIGGSDGLYSLVEASDGGYAIAGVTDNFDAGGYDAWLIKTDALGNVEWNKTYNSGRFSSLVEASDGGYAIAGIRNFSSPYDFDGAFWLVKTDEYGNMEWNKTYTGTGCIEGRSLVATSDGGYAFAGFTESFGAGGYDVWLVKTDSFGNVEWNRTYGGTEDDVAYSLVNASDGGYAIAGSRDGDCWLVKTDACGNMEWNKTYARTYLVEFRSLVEASDGGYAIAGTAGFAWGDGAGGYDFWLVKIDASGNMEWNKTYGGTGHDEACSLVVTSDGGYAIAGTYSCSFILAPHGTSWLVKTDEFGNMEWNKTYAEEQAYWTYSLVAASDGGYAIVSQTSYSNSGGVVLIKTDEFGEVPEASWVVLPLLLAATLAIFISKKKLLHRRS
jgi:predicted secreted protein